MASAAIIPDQSYSDQRLREIALHAALHSDPNNVVARAQKFYEFLKGEKKDG